MRWIARLIGHGALHAIALTMLLFAFTAPASAAQDQVVAEGRADYETYCLACHGATGRGDGAMAEILVVPPTDLTTIAARNDGRFPFWRVYRIINGREAVAGHETFQMPLLGQRFQQDEAKAGYLPAYIRVLLITHYLDSIQAR